MEASGGGNSAHDGFWQRQKIVKLVKTSESESRAELYERKIKNNPGPQLCRNSNQ
jgi:hypothetical protein